MSVLVPLAIWFGLAVLGTLAAHVCGKRLELEEREREVNAQAKARAEHEARLSPEAAAFSRAVSAALLTHEVQEWDRRRNGKASRP